MRRQGGAAGLGCWFHGLDGIQLGLEHTDAFGGSSLLALRTSRLIFSAPSLWSSRKSPSTKISSTI